MGHPMQPTGLEHTHTHTHTRAMSYRLAWFIGVPTHCADRLESAGDSGGREGASTTTRSASYQSLACT
eukprot:2684771-Amphidinium_carterae.3